MPELPPASLKGFGHPQKETTEIWEDKASWTMMSENPTNRDRSKHVHVKVHYLRDLVRDGHVKLFKCAGTQKVSDVLTKSSTQPALRNTANIMMWEPVYPFQRFSSFL